MNKLLRCVAVGVLPLVACSGAPGGPKEEPAPALLTVNQFKLAALPDAGSADAGQCSPAITSSSELLIDGLAVVEDPVRTVWTGHTDGGTSDGAWSFGRLMTSMAGANEPSAFVLAWLQQWQTNQTVNGFVVAARPSISSVVLTPWLTASGGTKLDLTKAPFRLLAIVNRMDLGNLAAGSAGEARFVFGVLDSSANQLPFTVILEYQLPASTSAEVVAWAERWHALSSLAFGSPAYNAALQALTDSFAGPRVVPSNPNGSALDQVRTNEIALSAPWEMRQFHLDATRDGALVETTVAQTPDLSLNQSTALASFINTNSSALLAGTDVIPASFGGAPFLGGSAPNNLQFWSAPGITNNDARFALSVNTCSGCHGGETGTTFLHIAPRNLGSVSQLSGFLTGKFQPDPVVSGVTRSFNDLANRSNFLTSLLCASPASATLAVTAPAAGATVNAPTTFQVSAGAGVTAVQYFVDASAVSPALTSPFSFQWNPAGVKFGAHSLTAQGTTATGTVTSKAVAFTTAPTSGPDFVITQVVAPPSVLPGQSFNAQVTACNRGGLSGQTTVALFASVDDIITPSDLALAGTGSVTLAPAQCSTVSLATSATPPGPGSAFFIGAVANLGDVTPELNFNNDTSSAVPLNIGAGPDFVLTAAHASADLQAGSPFSAEVTVCNQGTEPGEAPVAVVISATSAISANGPTVGSAPSPFLAPGQCAVVSVPATALPPGQVPGLFFLAAVVNPGQALPELNLANDVSPISTLGIGSAPDFTVSTVTAAASAQPGALFESTVTVCNIGTLFGVAPVQLALAQTKAIQAVPNPSSEVFVGAPVTVALAPGACSSVVVQAPATPPAGTSGPYFVGAIVDPTNTVPELNKNNNSGVAPSAMGIGFGPDFTLQSIDAPNSATPGGAFLTTVVLCNQGTEPGATSVSLFLSLSSTVAVGSPPSPLTTALAGQGPSISLIPGQCESVAIPSVGSAPVSPGPLFLVAVANATASAPELNVNNNDSSAFGFDLGFGPDFVITAAKAPATVAAGAAFTAEVTICNQGTASGQTPLELVISGSPAITAASPAAGFANSPSLSPGACSTVPVPAAAVAPGPVPGVYFLGAIANPNQVDFELNFANDVSPISKLGIGSAPDFIITSVSAPASASLGGLLSSTVEVCNVGTLNGSTPVQLVLSNDTVISPVFLNPGVGDDAPVGSAVTVSLNAGACASVALQGAATPPGGGQGLYYVGALVETVSAFNTTNDTGVARSQTAIGSSPDFVIQSLSAPSSALPGSAFTATAQLCNQGTLAGATSGSLFLSVGASVPVGAAPNPTTTNRVGQGPSVSLNPGQCVTQTLNGVATPPPAGAAAPLFLVAVANANGAVAELNEANNGRAVSLPVGAAPDFEVSALSLVVADGGLKADGGDAGDAGVAPTFLNAPFQASVTVCNQGTEPGVASLDLVISAEAVIENPTRAPSPGQAVIVTNPTASFSLSPAQCLSQLVDGIAVSPTQGPGSFFLGAVANLSNPVVELTDGNQATAVIPLRLQ